MQVEAREWWWLVVKDERVNRRAGEILCLNFGCPLSCPLFLHVSLKGIPAHMHEKAKMKEDRSTLYN